MYPFPGSVSGPVRERVAHESEYVVVAALEWLFRERIVIKAINIHLIMVVLQKTLVDYPEKRSKCRTK